MQRDLLSRVVQVVSANSSGADRARFEILDIVTVNWSGIAWLREPKGIVSWPPYSTMPRWNRLADGVTHCDRVTKPIPSPHERGLVMGNPYRQKKPSAPAIVAKGRFYSADESGRRISSFGQYLLLTSTYLWIDDTLSIPLESITELATTKRGGCIQFWDAIAGVEMDFHFTLPGFFRPRMGVVNDFLREIAQQRERQSGQFAPSHHTSDASPLPQIDSCEECGSNGTDAYTFSTFRFIGIAPIAYSYKLTPQRFVLCKEHARGRAYRVNVRNALFGYLGFPGFLAAPWYILRNLRELKRHDLLTVDSVLKSVITTVVLPLACVAFLLFLFARWAATV